MRMIDADKIEYATDNESDCEMKLVTKEMIDEMPTIDAVPVVRCKDCKWYECCNLWFSGDEFCSDGERKENNETY